MIDKPLFASLTRISDLDRVAFGVSDVPRSQWATGDYVVGIVTSRANASTLIELPCGRLTEPMLGDHVIGALGVRSATLEATGHWNEISENGHMHSMTAAGLIGKATSVSTFISAPLELTYCGHCTRDEQKVTMSDFVHPPNTTEAFDIPTILIIGTSMSAGKTTSAKVIIRQLVRSGLRVAGVKFTGAGRLKDTLAMRDAGAESILDFVDVGLPSTVCSPSVYRPALDGLLRMLMTTKPDVVVAEAGASPIEPYNGDTFMDAMNQHVCFTVLCASDPYAVVGVQKGFGYRPDLVAGLATSTMAGVDVIEKMSGVKALNLLDPASQHHLANMLSNNVGPYSK